MLRTLVLFLCGFIPAFVIMYLIWLATPWEQYKIRQWAGRISFALAIAVIIIFSVIGISMILGGF